MSVSGGKARVVAVEGKADTFCVHVDAPGRHAARVRHTLLRLVPAGFEERALPRGVRFIAYAGAHKELKALHRVLSRAFQSGPAATESTGVKVQAIVAANDWEQRWTEHLGRQQLSSTVTVLPLALSATPPRTRQKPPAFEIYLRRRSAFGFGEHATTRLMTVALERALKSKPGPAVLDVGTGTGILAIIAAVQGARRCRGIDIDAASVRIAQENARLNRVLRRCTFDLQPLEQVRGRYDLVLANLDTVTVLSLASQLARVLAADGTLMVSGVLQERQPEVDAALGSQSLDLEQQASEAGWCLLLYRHKSSLTRLRSA